MSERAMMEVAKAIDNNLTSPNCVDSNFEPANVVDGLYAIARALDRVAKAIDRYPAPEGVEQ